LAQSIIDEGLSIVYRARARFSDAYTMEYCELLYRSGCRYLGMGLEAASPRVNALVNKHRGSEIDYRSVLDNMDAVGIRAHVYSILGFPTETRPEISETFEFLVSSIEKYKYLTVSPNLFYLMRGSGMAQHPELFGLNVHNVSDSVALVLSFSEPQHDANLLFALDAVRRVHQKQFLPNVEDPEFAEEFWHFIDQTGIFYLQKVFFSHNPYKHIGRRVAAVSSLQVFASTDNLFWLKPDATGDEWLLCDWVTYNFCLVPSLIRQFFEKYDDTATVHDNIERHVESQTRLIAEDVCAVLLKNGFLVGKFGESLQAVA
jgi:hypothetical protein